MKRRMRGWGVLFLVLRMAIRSIAAHPSRAILTLVGSVFGVFGMVTVSIAVVALSTTIREAVLEYGPGVYSVQQGNRGEEASSRFPPLDPALVTELRARSSLARFVSAQMWLYGQRVTAGARATEPITTLVGASVEAMEANSMHLARGRFLIQADLDHERPVIVLGAHAAEQLFEEGAGLGAKVEIAGEPLEVIGILAPALGGERNDFAFLPVTTFEKRWGRHVVSLTVQAADPARIEESIQETTSLLRHARRLAPDAPNNFLIVGNQLAENMLKTLMVALSAAMGALSLISLVVGGIGLTNITLAAVGQRTREIGLLMAIGARPRVIWTQFLAEAVVLAMFGGAGGLLLSFAVAAGASALLGVAISTPTWAIALAFGASALTGVLAGAYPAAIAASCNPVEAFRADA